MRVYNLRYLFFFLFALSGFSGLIYESIWSHYLKLFLGHAAYAQTLVLAIFMGGMALGSWICSRYSVRWRNLILMYAMAEALVGVMALLFHDTFQSILTVSHLTIIPALDSVTLINLFKWSSASIIIFPQSVLLGMTFPLMSAGIIRRFPEKSGSTVAMLYFTNSIGGAIGVLVSGFLLIKAVGLPGTIVVAGLINIVLAAIVWALATKSAEPAPKLGFQQQSASAGATNNVFVYLLLTTALLTGVASFIYEIGWIRMLSMVLGSSTNAFELMLSAFIFGLAFGGLWIRSRIDRINDTVNFLAYIQIIMGLAALSTLLLYGNSFNVMQWLVNNLDKTDSGYMLFNVASHGIAMAIMLPTTFCAGTTLPLITYSLLKEALGERSIGAVYGMNTVGAIVGVFLTVHLLLPYIGLKGVIVTGALIDILLGVVLFWWLGKLKISRKAIAMSAMGLLAIATVVFAVKLDTLRMASAVYRSAEIFTDKDVTLVRHRDGKTASIDLTDHNQQYVAIRTNGKPDASINMNNADNPTQDEATMTLAAAIPLMLHPQAKTAANIGMGSGLTTHVLLTAPTVEIVDTIEIEEAMVDVAQGFRPRNELAYTDSRSQIHIEDAKTFFSTHNRYYDIIVSEPSNPWVSGTASLFTDEFYSLITRHLNKQGLLVQWLQLYEINVDLVVSMLKALAVNFDDFVIFAANAGDILIVAKNDGKIAFLDDRLLQFPQFANELSRLGFRGVQDIEFRRIVNKSLLSYLLKRNDVAMNSDYYPIVDQNAARTRFLNANAQDILSIGQEPIPTLEALGVYVPTWNNTKITPMTTYPSSVQAFMATKIRDQLLGLALNNVYGDSRKHVISTANNFSMLFADCNTPPSHGDRVFILLDMALKLVAYLRPQELQQIWDHLDVQRCGAAWSAYELQWLNFIVSVGARDTSNMARLASELLRRDEKTTTARKKYLLAAAMLGYIAQSQNSKSLMLWTRYATEIFGDQEPRMMFRILVEISKANQVMN